MCPAYSFSLKGFLDVPQLSLHLGNSSQSPETMAVYSTFRVHSACYVCIEFALSCVLPISLLYLYILNDVVWDGVLSLSSPL